MRAPGVFLAGCLTGGVLGMALSLAWSPGAAPAPTPAPRSDPEGGLGEALASARREVEELRSRLAEAGAAEERGPRPLAAAEDVPARRRDLPAAGPELDHLLARLERDVLLQELFHRHTREEGSFPHWTPLRFLQDPAVNPRQVPLEDEERRRFESLFSHHYQRITVIDLWRQLAVAEAVFQKLGEPTPAPASAPGAAEGALVVSLPGGVQAHLTPEEFPEIQQLDQEKAAAIVSWLEEARAFFAGRE
jgi:hypothetical protein